MTEGQADLSPRPDLGTVAAEGPLLFLGILLLSLHAAAQPLAADLQQHVLPGAPK